MIDLKEKNKAEVLAKLYNASKAQGLEVRDDRHGKIFKTNTMAWARVRWAGKLI